MFKKLLFRLEKLINWVEKDKEEQARKIRDKRAAYLEEQRKKRDAETRKAYKQGLAKRASQRTQKLSAYTTMEEFESIIESPQYKKLSDKDRDIFLQRAHELRQQDHRFAEDYKKWQNKKAAAGAKFNNPANNQDIISI